MELLKGGGLLDNTILVMNSDHGYPDPTRQLSFYERRKFGHDLIMTDDNILTPLFLSYPGCRPNSITTPVSLLDISPTILELIGLPNLYEDNGYTHFGNSLMGYIKSSKKKNTHVMRIDNRFIFQDNRMAAVRDSRRKYVRSFEDSLEELYDLEKDPGELNNLIQDGRYEDELEDFRNVMYQQELAIYSHHENVLNSYLEKIIRKNEKSLIILGEPHHRFISMMSTLLYKKGYEKIYLTGRAVRILRVYLNRDMAQFIEERIRENDVELLLNAVYKNVSSEMGSKILSLADRGHHE